MELLEFDDFLRLGNYLFALANQRYQCSFYSRIKQHS